MSKRSRKRRRRERQRQECQEKLRQGQEQLQLVCVAQSDWRSLYRVRRGNVPATSPSVVRVRAPAATVDRPTANRMEWFLRTLGWTDAGIPAVAAPMSDVVPRDPPVQSASAVPSDDSLWPDWLWGV